MHITPKHSIGIIGGAGRTGGQFARLFRSKGFKVRVTGSKTKDRNRELLRSCDVVIFALPLICAAAKIRKLMRFAQRKDQLLLDVSSLKTNEVKAMLRGRGEVIGMHPLFGPSTDPRRELIILCPGRASSETMRSLEKTLHAMQLRTAVMTPEAHDKRMAIIQVLPHLKSYLVADTLRSLQVKLPEIVGNCTPTYELEFNVVARFLDDDPSLYMPIIFRNPETLKMLKMLRKSLDRAIGFAERRDIGAASRLYDRSKTFFSRYLRRARSHSEACIRTLLSLSR